jgi:hypothetical protein
LIDSKWSLLGVELRTVGIYARPIVSGTAYKARRRVIGAAVEICWRVVAPIVADCAKRPRIIPIVGGTSYWWAQVIEIILIDLIQG